METMSIRISDISPGGGVERREEGEEISGSGHSTSKLMRARDSCVGMASALGGPPGKWVTR